MKHITFPDTQPSDADSSQRFSMGHHPTEPSKLRLVDLGTRPDKLLAGIQGIHHKLLSKLFVFGNPTSTWPRILRNFASRKAFFAQQNPLVASGCLEWREWRPPALWRLVIAISFLKNKIPGEFWTESWQSSTYSFFRKLQVRVKLKQHNECKLKTSAGS